jgi:hypothetical protein
VRRGGRCSEGGAVCGGFLRIYIYTFANESSVIPTLRVATRSLRFFTYTPITLNIHIHTHPHDPHIEHTHTHTSWTHLLWKYVYVPHIFHQKTSWHHVIPAQSVTLTRHLHHIPFKPKKKKPMGHISKQIPHHPYSPHKSLRSFTHTPMHIPHIHATKTLRNFTKNLPRITSFKYTIGIKSLKFLRNSCCHHPHIWKSDTKLSTASKLWKLFTWIRPSNTCRISCPIFFWPTWIPDTSHPGAHPPQVLKLLASCELPREMKKIGGQI